MRDFIYRFDYEDPASAARNLKLDQEDYITGYLKIRASREADALAWGRTLADWLVMHLFGDSKPGRWSKSIGSDELWSTLSAYTTPLLDRVAASEAIVVGHYPNLDDLLTLLNKR